MTVPIIEARNLVRHYSSSSGRSIRAVDGVSFSVSAGETVGIVGESGCGKSTTGRLLMGLDQPSSGEVLLDGERFSGLPYSKTRHRRRRVQMVFQDPYASLNPRHTVGRIIEEPLHVHHIGTPAERRNRVAELIELTGLPADAASRYPHEFSGGQRQRVGIARALALEPALIVADEPVSALDVSVQAQVINLLVRLQREMGLSFLFISHDLSVVQYIADRILVMYLGRIVEVSDRAQIWSHPLHPYTAGLLAAHPTIDVDVDASAARRLRVWSDAPSQTAPQQGCGFHPRCAFATDLCRVSAPELRTLANTSAVACHHVQIGLDGSVISPMDRRMTAPVAHHHDLESLNQ